MRDERGGVAVIVALLMVPLIGFTALSLDVAALWGEKQQLHNGADAAALAIAQDCSKAAPTCTTGGAAATAQTMASGNHPRSSVTATVTSLTSTQVTVRTTATRTDLFAPVLGVRSSSVNASATAAWGAPSGGTAVLPLAFSWCEWSQQTGGTSSTVEHVIYLTKTSQTPADCTGPSNNIVPGGFGWLTVNSGGCGTATSIGNLIASDPGNSVPNGCSTSSFSSLVGKTVLLPLFDSYSGSGSGATYRIFGYAAFQLTGYSFGGQYSAGTGTCTGNARCVKGYFTRFVSLSEAFTYSAGAPALGAAIVTMKS